uniref:Uncharacterized protein n=1 Tax=Kalanchoe fedtschenkoi TaxID=63787 RepID=A0A7N0VJ82_KALFE
MPEIGFPSTTNRRSGIPPPPRPAFLVERLPTSHSSSPPQPQVGGPQPTRHALQICSLRRWRLTPLASAGSEPSSVWWRQSRAPGSSDRLDSPPVLRCVRE